MIRKKTLRKEMLFLFGPCMWIKLANGIYVSDRGYVRRVPRTQGGCWLGHSFGKVARYPYRTLRLAQRAVEDRE